MGKDYSGNTGTRKEPNDNAILNQIKGYGKALPVSFVGGLFVVPEDFFATGICFSDDSGGSIINVSGVSEAEGVYRALPFPVNSATPFRSSVIKESGTTAVGIFVLAP